MSKAQSDEQFYRRYPIAYRWAFFSATGNVKERERGLSWWQSEKLGVETPSPLRDGRESETAL